MSKKIYVKNVEVASKSYADSSFEAARSYTDAQINTVLNTTLVDYVKKYVCTESEYANMTEEEKQQYDLFIINPNPAEEYVEVDYIESNGTQYIDTGVLASSNIKMDLVLVEPDLSVSNGVIYGGGDGWLNNYIQGESDSPSTFAFGDNWSWVNVQTAGDSIHIVQDGNLIYINDTLDTTFEPATFSSDYNIYLFAYNRGGEVGEYGSYKLSSCKISENGNLVRDFMPCYRARDHKYGLYDRLGGQFYPMQGTSGYTEISYVENISTYYIQPSLTLNDGANYSVVIDCEPTDLEHSGEGNWEGWVMAAYDGGQALRIGMAGDGTWRVEPDNSAWTYSPSNTCQDGVRVTISGSVNNAYISTGSPLTFFTQFENGRVYPDRWFLGKIYNCQIYRNNLLIRNLTPVSRDSDGVTGLYDSVYNTFYPMILGENTPIEDEEYYDEEV